MIFVTVGTQVAFDRLISAVDDWTRRRERNDVVAQIGPSKLEPKHIKWTQRLPRDQFLKEVQTAKVLVAHAGLGTIIMALERCKPIVIFPRRAKLKEQRNDHQLATARAFVQYPGIAVAFDAEELWYHLDHLQSMVPPEKIGPDASPELLSAVKDFIDED
jgi:UDP-N-acetylglucosamine transferase subunit ALG13